MAEPKPNPTFADVFPRPQENDWLARAAAALKGLPFDTLVSQTRDGIAIQPLYQRLKQERPRALRATAGPWRVAARVDHDDPLQANESARADIAGGANALDLVFAGAGAYGFGLAAEAAALETVLADVALDQGVAIALDAGAAGAQMATSLAAHIEARHLDPTRVDIHFCVDPIGSAALTGRFETPWPETASNCAQQAKQFVGRGFAVGFFVADGRLVHMAGGSAGQELAFTLATGVAYLRALDGSGIDLDAAHRLVTFRLAADADVFVTIAKFRALRRLWARVETSCGLAARPIHIHAETAWRMMTRRDPWTNMLRATAACSAAGMGGADAITVLPFTQALGLPDAFARRIARNTQAILIEEAHLGHVADPAAGAGGFEALTENLCNHAWSEFQRVEKLGGIEGALTSGAFQTDVAATREARDRDIASDREPIVGTSLFADPTEAAVAVLKPISEGNLPAKGQFEPLVPRRDALIFERLPDPPAV